MVLRTIGVVFLGQSAKILNKCSLSFLETEPSHEQTNLLF